MTTIRPNLPPLAQPSAAPGLSGAARAAARAFFDLAGGQAPTSADQGPPRAPAAAAPQRRAQIEVDPARPLRPGSLLDIRV